MPNKGQANEGPRPMDRDAQALKQSKPMKEPAVTDYRESLGNKEMRETKAEEKAMSTVKALEQKEGEYAVTQLPRK